MKSSPKPTEDPPTLAPALARRIENSKPLLVSDWMFLSAHPMALSEVPYDALGPVLTQLACPAPVLEWAYTHFQKDVYARRYILISIARNPNAPRALIQKLLRLKSDSEVSQEEGLL